MKKKYIKPEITVIKMEESLMQHASVWTVDGDKGGDIIEGFPDFMTTVDNENKDNSGNAKSAPFTGPWEL
ncbi:hypothetical protein E5358_10190 [Palleniella muris]|uniref:Uncharacterized protein n=1 Tax=Palleniella muris TaxID=3038145 RepID=A0AC61QNX8_9BACT|nr:MULTISPECIES: hypothetical protein [Palleniella]NPD81727.1 hypothetical protein [Palleniella intestinalis]TGX81495.1 hypothetical protein E5358_10190 [Palleniella muris]